MTRNDNILDELFRSKLNDFEEVPPSYVWMGIREKQRVGRRKRLLNATRLGGIAAAILLAFLLGWQLQKQRGRMPERSLVADHEQPVDRAPSQTRQKEAGPGRNVVKAPVTIRETPSSADPLKHKKGRVTDIDRGQDIQNTGQMLVSIQPVNLLTITDTEIKEPELTGDLKEYIPNRLADKTELTERDLLVIEMNRQIQERAKIRNDDKNWSVGALVSPAFSVNRSSYDASYASNMSRPGEKQYLTMGGGISVQYQTGKRWSVQSGLHYSRLGQSSGTYGNNRSLAVNNSLEYASSNNKVQLESGKLLMNASAGVIEINQLPSTVRVSSLMESSDAGSEVLLTNDDFDQRFEYIEIPLFVRYQLIDRTWNVHMLGGVSANMLVGNNAYLKDGNSESYIGKTKDMNQMNYSAGLGVGLGYQLTNKIQLQIEPQLKYYLQSLSNNPDVTFKPYSIGIYTGVSYRF